MTLKIIVGTLFDITDPTGELLSLYQNGVFLKQVWNGTEWKSYNSGIISFDHTGTKINVVQETGAGKTVLLAIFAYRAHKRGRHIAGNLKIGWTENNKGKDKEDWKPAIRCIADLENANNVDLEIDDIYGTITAWNCEEADFIRTAALLARKSFVNINFTAQFTTNQIPPDLRRITGEYHIPFIRCLDATRKSPDGHNFPLEIIDLRFNGFFQYKGYKVYDLQSETGLEVLNGYDTLEVSTVLKIGGNMEEPRQDAPGFKTELEAFEYLCKEAPEIEWKHLNGKEVFDIQSDIIAIDVCGLNCNGDLNCSHKNLRKHITAAKKLGIKPFLMFKGPAGWKFVKINNSLDQRHRGENIDTWNMKTFQLKDIL